MYSRDIFLKSEGDAYYLRNKKALNEDVGLDVLFYTQFLLNNEFEDIKIVEIGASNGRNLNFFKDNLKCEVSGIEPSSKAISDGNNKFFNGDEVLLKGSSDSLPYDDESMDIVMFGFSLFWVDRKYLFKSISEADRILKTGGFLFITDFDTTNPYKRINVHNEETFTYKMDYANLFLSNPQYSLVEKKQYSHNTSNFNCEIQERVSAQILYKDFEDNVYIKD
ncbi:MAG: class I SAM-dependent methyltransferase [Methanobrevibacter sp.]|uniref:class I SAM-dependent methyltransferase n=1 Tax=Methanobrevibacter sp. TaxID=66852 RepID=UPI0025D246B8|nr:class I SAM-dependent methyltransferase [Methanobrevibacter sp.]MBE6508530.1 class I SAM-dependent methyltransferase [Methanobrevibacter sp.]